MKIGICTKCKKQGIVVMHHAHGYLNEHKDDVLPYCKSCHQKIHIKARKEGKCTIPVKELARLSRNSEHRRLQKENSKLIRFYETLMPCVGLYELIRAWPNRIEISVFFQATNRKKLYEIEI